MMSMLIPKKCKLASVVLRRSCFLCSFQEKVGSITECPFRRFDQALRAYEQNTGKPHPLAKRGSRPSNERRLFVAVNLNDTANLEWTADVTIGTPARAFSSQSPFWVAQTSKLTIKCVVSIDTFTSNMFVSGANCTNCQGHNLYDIDNSSTAFNENITSNVEFGGGNATGNIILEAVSIGGFEVSHGVYVLKEGAITDSANRSVTKKLSWPMKSILSFNL